MGTRAFQNAYVEVFFDDTTGEIVGSMAAFGFSDDFTGGGHTAGIPASGSPVAGYPWVKKIVGAAPPTLALVTNAAGGQIAAALTSASQAQEASLYFNDSLQIDVTKRVLFDARAALSVIPTGVASGFLGVTQAWVSGGALSSARYLGFGWAANGNLVCYSYDGTTTYAVAAAPIATGVQIVSDTNFHSFRIDASVLTDIAFYYDNVRCNTFGSVTWGATAANSLTQLFSSVAKASGTGVGTLTVDKIDVFANRT